MAGRRKQRGTVRASADAAKSANDQSASFNQAIARPRRICYTVVIHFRSPLENQTAKGELR